MGQFKFSLAKQKEASLGKALKWPTSERPSIFVENLGIVLETVGPRKEIS